ncbi:divergent PAP2 family protein, partial [Anaerospora sp.]|uniref:divergent PAP2 family protein n=1 Tax=Anaerospora sp. TaxID=1960278 RepID=UPI0028A2D955
VAVILASIVMYDAAGVRRAAGKQAKVLNKLMQELKAEHTVHDTRLKELLGHTPLEVLAGAILGFFIAYLFSLYYK